MSYRIAFTEPLPDELRRIAGEQLERAAQRLRDPERDPGVAVHDARKTVKKVRSLLRLGRDGLPRGPVRRLNGELRDAAQLLSGARDADVLLATFDDLAERFVGRLPEASFQRARAALTLPDAAPAGVADPAAEAADRLDAIATRIAELPWERVDGPALVAGLLTGYRRGAAALAELGPAPGDAALHDWRKRVKDLWYHERLLEALWPEVLPAYAAEAKRLSELLGDDHDLAVLHDALAEEDRAELGPLVDERRAALQAAARTLGARTYADAPKALRRRLLVWWDAAHDDRGALPAA